jgi:hypothetical protein
MNKMERLIYKYFDQIFIFKNGIYYIRVENKAIPYPLYYIILTILRININF